MDLRVVVLLVAGFVQLGCGRSSVHRPWHPDYDDGHKTTQAATSTKRPSGGDDSSEEYEDDGINWQCGTDDLSKMMSEASVEQTCRHLKVAINNCCSSHDNCYDMQFGQKNCDDKFCICLDVVTKNNESCNKGEAVIFCDLVRQYGAGPYAAASGTTKRVEVTGTTVAGESLNTTTPYPVYTRAPAPASRLSPPYRPPVPPRVLLRSKSEYRGYSHSSGRTH